MNRRIATDLHDVAAALGQPLQLVSRSDSTLRGHVMAEVDALSATVAQRDRPVDAVLFAPAFIEAGRVTVGDVHWSRVAGEWIPVGETEFAQDATFGYHSSNLRDFVAEVSGGRITRDEVLSISLDDIRVGGPDHVRALIASARGGAFVVVNALDYADLECVARAAFECRDAGQSLIFRVGPSMVRALDGQDPLDPLTAEAISAATPSGSSRRIRPAHPDPTQAYPTVWSSSDRTSGSDRPPDSGAPGRRRGPGDRPRRARAARPSGSGTAGTRRPVCRTGR